MKSVIARRTPARRPAGRTPGPRAGGGPRGTREWLVRLASGKAVPLLGMALALAMRLWALRWQPFVTVDGTEYIRFAEALAAGRAFTSIFPPGYPALVAIARLLVADRVLAAALVSLVAGVLLVWPVWWLGRRALGPLGSWIPVLLVALHPSLAVFSAVTMSESAYFLALYGGVALTAASRSLLAGLALGAAFAIRPEALVPALALAAGTTWRVARRQAAARRLALGLAGFLVLAVPCWLYFHATLGVWTPTPKLGGLHATVTDWRTVEPRLAPPLPRPGYAGLATLAQNWRVGLRQYPTNAVMHGRSLLGLWPAPLLLLSLAGLVRRRGLEAVPLLHLAAIPFLGLSAQPRFVLEAVPALAILAAVPLAATRGWWRAGLAVVALGGTIWCEWNTGPAIRQPYDSWVDSHERAGEWLSGVAPPGAIVMDRKPWVAFYAHRTYRVMPDEPYDTLIDAAVREHVSYLVVDQQFAEAFRKQLEPLLYDSGFRDREQRLELVYVGGRVAGYGLGIFRVLQPGERKSGQPPTIQADYLMGSRGAPAR